MAPDNEIIRELADWFIAEMRALAARQLGDQCELLLCASDLGVDTPRIRRILARIEAAEPDVSVQGERLLESVLRQLVYFRFGAALESRARFLDYWVNQRRFKGKDMFSVSIFVNLALQQQEFLTDQAKQYARTWYLRHPEIRAIRRRFYCSESATVISSSVTHFVKVLGDQRDISTTVPLIWPNRHGEPGLYLEVWCFGRWYKFHTPLKHGPSQDAFAELVTKASR